MHDKVWRSMNIKPESCNVRHLLVTVGPASFGVGPVALNLVREQRTLGIDAKIWCLDSPAEIEWAAESSGLKPEFITGYQRKGPPFLAYSPELEQVAIGREGQRIDVVHQHGIWTGISRVTNRWREKFDRPTVIAPHGSLERWAVNRSVWKKKLALWAYESRNLKDASCLHALAPPEAQGFREYGCGNPIGVISNGISDIWLQSKGNGASFRRKFRLTEGSRLILYLGRITPVKNLKMFVTAMGTMKDALSDWFLVIAGQDEFGYQRDVEAVASQLQMESWIRFVGPLFGEDKRNAFDAADVFVLPSHREASPIVVLEALGACVPVLTTQGTPWQELETYKCGWWTETNIDSMSRALCAVTNTSPGELHAMGQRGRQLVHDQYRWSTAAHKSLVLYEWLLGRAERPEFVLDKK